MRNPYATGYQTAGEPGWLLKLLGGGINMVPIVGSLASTLLQLFFATQDIRRMNRYNSPEKQLDRLREAGLPLAAYYKGGTGQQSELPRSVSIDPTMGAAQGLQQFQVNRMNKMALQLQGQDYRSKFAKADLDEGERDWNLNEGQIYYDKEGNPLEMVNNQRLMLSYKLGQEKFIELIKEDESRMQQVFADVEELMFGENVTQETRRQGLEKLKKEIMLLVSKDKILGQMYNDRELQELYAKQLTGSYENMPELLKTVIAFFGRLLSGGRASVGVGF